MSDEGLKWLTGPLTFHLCERLLYTNFAMRVDFRYGYKGIARHLFWRFWWVTGEFE